MSGFRRHRRRNGFSCPPHIFQITAWVLLLYFTLIVYLTIIPQFVQPVRITIGCITSVPVVIHYVTHLLATVVDPADVNLRIKLRIEGAKPVPELDRSKHSHVIENFFCNLCEIKISSFDTKHCSSCNKCVQDFDHHCKWLNNCVGGRNYRLFIAALVSAAASLLLVAGLSFAMVTAYFLDTGAGRLLQPYRDFQETAAAGGSNGTGRLRTLTGADLRGTGLFTVLLLPCGDLPLLLLLLLTCCLAAAGIVLLLQLLHFHRYLYTRGISTYDYILGIRRRGQQQQQQQQQPGSAGTVAKSCRLSDGRFFPAAAAAAACDASAKTRRSSTWPNAAVGSGSGEGGRDVSSGGAGSCS